MAIVKIGDKEHACSLKVLEEIVWLRIKLKSALDVASKIEEQQDEVMAEMHKRNNEVQKLINQLKNL